MKTLLCLTTFSVLQVTIGVQRLSRNKVPSHFEALNRVGVRPPVRLVDLTSQECDYEAVWALQKALVARRLDSPRASAEEDIAAVHCAALALPQLPTLSKDDLGKTDCLLLVEHPSTYTLGTGSTEAFVRFSEEERGRHRVIRTERGGEVTWHGPGQLVVYPILDLRDYRCDLHWYVRALEELVICSLREVGISNVGRIHGLTGVWMGENKVAAIGVKVRSWVTMHGVAINVDVDVSNGFNRIVPCGIEARGVTNVSSGAPDVTLESVKKAVLSNFRRVFEADLG